MRPACAAGVLVAVAAGLAAIPCPGAQQTPAPGAVLSRDSRLQSRTECRAPGRPVAAFLKSASAAAGVTLAADQEAGDQKVILLTGSARLGQVLDLVREHFGSRWLALPPEPGGELPAGYRLVETKDRQFLGTRLRDNAERERAERVLERLELRLRHLDSPPEVLARLRNQDDTIESMATDARLRARLRLAALLAPEERRAVASGRAFVSPTLDRLPARVQRLALEASGLRDFPENLAQLRFTIRREGEDGEDSLMLWVLGPEGRPIGRSSDLTFHRAPRREAAVSIVRYATSPQRKPAAPSFDRVAELLDEKEQPLPVDAGLPRLLSALARATGLDVLSDYYSGQTTRFIVEPLGRRPLWQLLNIVAEQYCLTWARKGSFLVFRHQEWYEVEPEEVPERVLDAWRTDKKPPGRATPAEFVSVVAALTAEQMRGLRFQFPAARLQPPYRWEQLLGALTPAQREALLAGAAVPGNELVGGHYECDG